MSVNHGGDSSAQNAQLRTQNTEHRTQNSGVHKVHVAVEGMMISTGGAKWAVEVMTVMARS